MAKSVMVLKGNNVVYHKECDIWKKKNGMVLNFVLKITVWKGTVMLVGC